jgi:hypothetical protein
MKCLSTKIVVFIILVFFFPSFSPVARETTDDGITLYYLSDGKSESSTQAELNRYVIDALSGEPGIDLVTKEDFAALMDEERLKLSGRTAEGSTEGSTGQENEPLPDIVMKPDFAAAGEEDCVLLGFSLASAPDGELLYETPKLTLAAVPGSEDFRKLDRLLEGIGKFLRKETGQRYPAARLKLVSRPEGAHLFLNGAYAGTTPFEGEIAPGHCRISLVKSGYETVSRYLLLEPEQSLEYEETLVEADYNDPKRYQFDYHRDYFFIPTWYLGTTAHTYFNRWAVYGFVDHWDGRDDGMTGLGMEGAWFNRGLFLGAGAYLFYPDPRSPFGRTLLFDVFTSPFLMSAIKAGEATLLAGATFHGRWLTDSRTPPGESPDYIHVFSAGINLTTILNIPLSPNDAFYVSFDLGGGYVFLRLLNGESVRWSGDGGFADLSSGYVKLGLGRSFF